MTQRDARVALVTGGGTGIGLASARMLSSSISHVVISSHLPLSDMKDACESIIADGGSASAETADVTDEAAMQAMIERIMRLYGRIDILVNAAGIFELTPVFERHMDRVQRLMNINFMGSVIAIQNVLPIMRRQHTGAIVSIASGAAILGQGGYAHYAASKAAIMHFTRTLSAELKGTGIRANCVAPGAVRTQMTALVHDPQSAAMRSALARLEATSPSPYGTAFMEPDDIAHIVVFLASDAARAIQGACIVADQGLSAAMPTLGT